MTRRKSVSSRGGLARCGWRRRFRTDAVLPRSFCGVEHRVRGFEHLLGRPSGAPGGNAGAHGDRGVRLGAALLPDGVADTLGEDLRVVQTAVGYEDQELIAAGAHSDVRGPDRLLDRVREA